MLTSTLNWWWAQLKGQGPLGKRNIEPLRGTFKNNTKRKMQRQEKANILTEGWRKSEMF